MAFNDMWINNWVIRYKFELGLLDLVVNVSHKYPEQAEYIDKELTNLEVYDN